MSSRDRCKECGAAIPTDSPGGFCAQCLLGLGLSDEGRGAEGGEQKSVASGQRPPEPDSPPPTGDAKSSADATSRLTEKPGDRIGRYRLLEEIGHGGCGVVYMAEQEEPVRRRVALKVIKLGMDTREVVARFGAERQALALMDHPNIARVLDAGATEAGRPYFVMELVGGIKITDYCDENNLTTRQRLDLFIQVCRAIQHAHQKGIIHRDIKPSNVLVTTHDGVAVPKVIDFGIAKAAQGRLTDHTLFTAFEQFIGTPAYMSPEQAQLGSLDVDTRSDIYSLGVLLYELLTSKTPFDAKELLAAGLETMRRMIQEKEPPTPSTRLKQELAKPNGESKKQKVEMETRELMKLLRGDLDWIVMKCLEKDRARRYETANGLARDIERHLNQEPVVARPPSRIYRVHKFVRRNRVTATTATAIATVLVLGIAASAWETVNARRADQEQRRLRQQAQRAQANESREREKAQTEAARSQQVAQFLTDMLEGVGPSVAAGRDTTMLREILDRTAERVARDLKDHPLVAAELQNTIGRVYLALSEAAKAERMHREALATCRKFLGNGHPEVAVSLLGLALACGAQGALSEAEALDREALGISRKHFPEGHQHVANSLNDLSRVLEHQGKHDEADALQQEALAMQRKIWGEESAEVALSLRNLGIIRNGQGRHAEAEKLMSEGLAIMRKVGTRPNVAWSLGELAKVFMEEGRLAEAEAALKEALAIQQGIYEENHHSVMGTLLSLGDLLSREGRLAEAETDVRAALAIYHKRPPEERADPNLSFWIGAVLQKMNKLAEAEDWYRQAVLDESKAPRMPPRSYIMLIHALVTVLAVEKKFSEIEASYPEWLQGVRARPPVDDCALAADLISAIAVTLLLREKFVESEQLARECLDIREKHHPDDWRTYKTHSLLGGCLLGQKRYTEAETLLLSGYEGLRRHEADIPEISKPRLKEVLQRLVQLYQATGKPNEAAAWKKRLDEFEQTQPGPKPSAALSAKPEA